VLAPQIKDFPWDACERVFPSWFSLIDRTSTVGAKLVRKAIDLYFGKSPIYCTLYDPRCKLYSFFSSIA